MVAVIVAVGVIVEVMVIVGVTVNVPAGVAVACSACGDAGDFLLHAIKNDVIKTANRKITVNFFTVAPYFCYV